MIRKPRIQRIRAISDTGRRVAFTLDHGTHAKHGDVLDVPLDLAVDLRKRGKCEWVEHDLPCTTSMQDLAAAAGEKTKPAEEVAE
jgi:hypothetical protein